VSSMIVLSGMLDYRVREALHIDTSMHRLIFARLRIAASYRRDFSVKEALVSFAGRLTLLDSSWTFRRLRLMERKCCAW
jgi:hypothetical protein